MKCTLAATAIVLATAAAANAATLWQGDLFITTASNGCPSLGTNVGDFAQVIFAPQGLPGNSTDQLSAFFPRGAATQIEPASGGSLNKATSYNLTNIDLNNANTATVPQSALNIKVTPYPVKAGNVVTISFSIANFYSSNNACSVTLSGTLIQRPGNLPYLNHQLS